MSELTDICKDIKKLNKLVQVMAELSLATMRESGIRPCIVETYRTQKRQNYLFCQGRTVVQATKAGIVKKFALSYCNPKVNQVTWTLNSIHKNRKALDVVPQRKINGRMSAVFDNNDEETKKIIKIMKNYGFQAGADWNNPDSAHFQVKGDFKKVFNINHNTVYVTRAIQRQLNKKLNVGLVVDGNWGPKTVAAVNMFRKSMGYKTAKGQIGAIAFKALFT